MDISTRRTNAGDLGVSPRSRLATAARSRYEDLVARASSVNFGGVPVCVAALADIIASKEWANRPNGRAALVGERVRERHASPSADSYSTRSVEHLPWPAGRQNANSLATVCCRTAPS